MAKDIPGLSASQLGDNARPIERIREELQTLLGFRGDALDAAITYRQAIERGLIDALGRALTGSPSYTNIYPVIPGGSGVSVTPDLTPPPTPTGLTVQAGFTQVIVQWDAPTYTTRSGTAPNMQTNVYAVKKDPADATLPTFSPGVTPRVFVAPGALNVVSLPSELNTRWHIWITFESIDEVESLVPAGGVNGYNQSGAFPTTGQDIVQLLEILTGQIRESQLYAALAEPIRSIVRRADDAGEDALRAALATHQESKRAVNALLTEAALRGTAITQTRTLVEQGDAQLASQITTLTATVATNLGTALAAVQTEETARAGADAAEAVLRETLATSLIGAPDPTGLALGTITAGMLYDERQTRSTETGALASRATALESSVNTPSTGLLARATALETVTTNVSSGNAALATRAGLLEASVDTAGTGLLSRASALETVTTAALSGNSALASRASALEATVNNGVTGVAATANALDVVETLVNDGTTGVTALATRTSTLEARVTTPSATPGDPAYNVTYAGLQTEQSVRAALDGAVQALYTVRTEVSSGGRTVVGGFGLAATATAGAGPRIDFGVRADQFYVAAPSGSGIADSFPFIIRTSASTENGVSIPAGVFMDSAYIVNLSAMYARFGTLIADSIAAGQISAANLTIGDGSVGGDLKSTSFSSGSGVTPGAGWKLTPGGTLYASNAVLYGTVYAAAGAIGGNTIDATGMQSPGYSAPTLGWRFDTSGLLRAFADSGNRVLDMAATGAQPVLKIGTALELLANGDAFFGGRLAIGSVSANGSTTASASFPSLPNSSATYSTGAIAFSPAASITGVGGNISAWVSCDIRVGAESIAVDSIRVFAYLYRNGTQVDSSEVFTRSCVFPDPTGATRVAAAEVTLFSPLEPLTGAQAFTIGFDVRFYNSAGAAVSPGPTAFTSYLQVLARANLQEIKV